MTLPDCDPVSIRSLSAPIMENDGISIHHTTGRIRARSAHFKRNAEQTHLTRGRLARLEGVWSVEVSPLTGSLLIYFDPSRRDLEAHLLKALRTGSLSQLPAPVLGQLSQTRRQTSRPARRLAKIALTCAGDILLGHLVEVMIAFVL